MGRRTTWGHGAGGGSWEGFETVEGGGLVTGPGERRLLGGYWREGLAWGTHGVGALVLPGEH